jgi:uncharacterized protein YqhQ
VEQRKPGEPLRVGGQAILEGVMMRSPNSMAIVCRKPDGRLVVKETQWISLWHRLKFLRWPFLRGTIVLIEAMWNGIQALTFSAKVLSAAETEKQTQENAGAPPDEKIKEEKPLSSAAITGTIIFSLGFAIALFVVLPHFATIGVGLLVGHELTVDMFLFHLVDGLIKVLLFVAYVWGISFLPDIRRTFEYHGAEHKSIFAFDDGKELTLDNVRPYTTHHPRCGTSFILVVLITSILLFSLAFPLLPKLTSVPKIARNLIYIAIKLPLLFPIAGFSYELIRLAGKYRHNPLLRLAVLPGLLSQRVTTKPPTDAMLEVAIISMKKCLWREKQVEDGKMSEDSETEYPDFAAALAEVGRPEFFFKGGACDVQ